MHSRSCYYCTCNLRQALGVDNCRVDDVCASSLQPSMVPAAEDLQQPLEAQGRGFTHGHSKGHSRVGVGIRWVRTTLRQQGGNLVEAVKRLRSRLLCTAATVQYESAREPGLQLGVSVMPEPFTALQQKQSRMDGGIEDDGSRRDLVPVEPAFVQPHIAAEQRKACAEGREARAGTLAFKEVPLTGAIQSIFPAYRQRASFCDVFSAPEPDACAVACRSLHELFEVDEEGKVVYAKKPNGETATEEEIRGDAAVWARAFAEDVYGLSVANHEHACVETCIKYQKKRQEAQESLRRTRCPTCRFGFFRVLCIKRLVDGAMRRRRVRRRGKPLVTEPYVETSDERNDRFRCKVKREQPFRSATNDVCQSGDRCNTDFQFLGTAPLLPEEVCEEDSAAVQAAAQQEGPSASEPGVQDGPSASEPGVQNAERMAGEPGGGQNMRWRRGLKDTGASLVALGVHVVSPLSADAAEILQCITDAFRKAMAMDYYITKYQSKVMEALAPLFKSLLPGIQRLAAEQEEEDAAKEVERQRAEGAGDEEGPSRKRGRTIEELRTRARKHVIRLASAANRCYWLSTCEVAIQILTGGDCVQSHKNVRLFTRQLAWAMQECKRNLNEKGSVARAPEVMQSSALAGIRFMAPRGAADDQESMEYEEATAAPEEVSTEPAEQPGRSGDAPELAEGSAEHGDEPRPVSEEAIEGNGEEEEEEVRNEDEAPDYEQVTTSTNTADDYAHRGPELHAMPYYLYRSWIYRVPRSGRGSTAVRRFSFTPHYVLAHRYEQALKTSQDIVTIDGFQCPTVLQDAEQNALLKALLFTPWRCCCAQDCNSVMKFRHMMSNGDSAARLHTFARAWRLRQSELHVLAQRAEEREAAARKSLTLRDTTFGSRSMEPRAAIEAGNEVRSMLLSYSHAALRRTMTAEGIRRILAFAGMQCSWHSEQCTLAEYCAFVARDVLGHMELAAEARVKEGQRALRKDEDAEIEDDEGAPDEAGVEKAPGIVIDDIGNAGFDDIEDDEEDDSRKHAVSLHPLTSASAALRCAFHTAAYEAALPKKRHNDKDRMLLELHKAYGPMLAGDFRFTASATAMDTGGEHFCGLQLGAEAVNALQRQRVRIELAKKQQSLGELSEQLEESEPFCAPEPGEEQEPFLVPLPLVLQGPGAVAWHLVENAGCTEEQRDAVALLAADMEDAWRSLPEPPDLQKQPLLPLCAASPVHRALWLGGGGVGKTHTLRHVVEPLAVSFYGPQGYLPTAQANHACQNLGPRGRTLHNANGLMALSSLQTARLRLSPADEKKLLRSRGPVGVEVTDEVGTVPGDLLHADSLRSTYIRARVHRFSTAPYMRPEETWGRVRAKILCGDFYQLPPVPPTASLLLSTQKQSYEHQQGHALLAGLKYVVDFKQTKRFDDPLLVEILAAMREPGGRKLSDEAWAAIQATQVGSMGTDDPAFGRASEPAASGDPRLSEALGWHHAAYEWSIVHFAMQAEARRSAKGAKQPLYLVQAVDRPALQVPATEYEAILAEPNVSNTKKLLGILPTYVGMEMILTVSLLPPRYTPGARVVVTGIELHPDEPPITGRASLLEHGCVLLRFMPLCIYVKLAEATDNFLQRESVGASEPGDDISGAIGVEPIQRSWRFKSEKFAKPLHIWRTQVPVLPRKQTTLHGVQGTTAEPGLVAYWRFPKKLSKESRWLAHYVILSRPRRLANLLSLGLPDRAVIEGGPPASIRDAFQRLFAEKIEQTNLACQAARRKLKWPQRA